MQLTSHILDFPPPPRKVRRRSGGCVFIALRLFILPHVIGGAIVLLSVPANFYVEHFGTSVAAVVDRLKITTGKKGDGYEIYYHYVLNGRRYGDSASVGPGTYNATHVGDKAIGRAGAILGHALFLGPEEWRNGGTLMWLGMALFWNGIIGIFVYNLWFAPLRDRHVVRWGKPAVGMINGRWEESGKGGPHYHVKYVFATEDGRQFKGSAQVANIDYAWLIDGTPILILYMPNRPRWNLAYEHCEYEAIDRYARL